MVICVQSGHLLSVLHEMCAHKNLATYTPGAPEVSRVEFVILETGMQEQRTCGSPRYAGSPGILNGGRAGCGRVAVRTRRADAGPRKANDQALSPGRSCWSGRRD